MPELDNVLIVLPLIVCVVPPLIKIPVTVEDAPEEDKFVTVFPEIF